MIEAKRPFLDKAIEEAGNRHFERVKVNEAVPALRRRIAGVIRRHMPPPSEIGGRKVVSNMKEARFFDCIDDAVFTKLNPTELGCKTITKGGKEINVTLSSSIYPSGDEAETIKNREKRSAALYVDIDRLDYYFGLGIGGGVYVKWKEGSRHEKTESEANMEQINELREAMGLIEGRMTKFFPKPYSLHL